MRDIDLDAERSFENKKAAGSDVRSAQSKFYWAVDIEIQAHRDLILRKISAKKILEIGCASGDDAVEYSKYCSNYTGLDISDGAIKNCIDRGLPNASFICSDGHNIPFEDSSFDCVIVNCLLHHMDFENILREISRVLRSDGRLIFQEPLGTNPIFQLYRSFTPSSRTDDERPLGFKEIRLIKAYFDIEIIQWIGFLVIIAAFFRNKSFRLLHTKIDGFLSRTPAKFFFWQIAGAAKRKSSDPLRG